MLGHPDEPGHIAGCVDCQARYSLAALDVDLDTVWSGVAAEVWSDPVRPVEKLVRRLLGSAGLARALVTTPSLVLSWMLASAVVLGVGAVVTRTTGTAWVALLAPGLAGIGISYAYGPGIDPAFELSQTMAIPDRLVLLVRGLTVFAVYAVLGLSASLFTATATGITLSWLVPMTTVSALGLAAATLARSANVGVAIGLSGWGLMVLASAVRSHDLATAVIQPALVPGYIAATVLFVALALYATSNGRPIGRTFSR
jgi:hypothetical protein